MRQFRIWAPNTKIAKEKNWIDFQKSKGIKQKTRFGWLTRQDVAAIIGVQKGTIHNRMRKSNCSLDDLFDQDFGNKFRKDVSTYNKSELKEKYAKYLLSQEF